MNKSTSPERDFTKSDDKMNNGSIKLLNHNNMARKNKSTKRAAPKIEIDSPTEVQGERVPYHKQNTNPNERGVRDHLSVRSSKSIKSSRQESLGKSKNKLSFYLKSY